MKKELFKEIPFGKAIARIEVKGSTIKNDLDGWKTGTQTLLTISEVKIIKEGKVVARASFAKTHEYNFLSERMYEQAGLDKNKSYSTVDRMIAEGAEVGKAINAAIAEMKAEIEIEFQGESEAEKAEKEETEIAQETVRLAEQEGIANLLSAAELRVWRRSYNALYNEGGEGYIPTRISKEEYERAKALLNKK